MGMNEQTRKQLQAWIDEDGYPAVAEDLQVGENAIARWLGKLSKPLPDRLQRLKDRLAERAKGGAA